jgi:hypothetical protein
MPLTRTRRRLLIATPIVMGLLVASWMRRPWRDPRFVGTWVTDKRDNGQFVFWTTKTTFHADGRMESMAAGDPGPEQYYWRVEGNHLIQYDPGYDYPAVLHPLFRILAGRYQHQRRWRHEILSVGENELRLRGIELPFFHENRMERLDEPTFDARP